MSNTSSNITIAIAITACVAVGIFIFESPFNVITKPLDEDKKQNVTKPNSVANINLIPEIQKKVTVNRLNGEYKIAFVNPTFTKAAYHNAFYDFYTKYHYAPENIHVYADLNLLTATPPDKPTNNTAFFYGLKYSAIKLLPNSKIVTINDEDVHDGKIFDREGNNAYDVLILGHDEYVTQTMYDNYKKFVDSGGTLMALDGNIFYAEVHYNPTKYTVTLVKGHGWEYNGIYAAKSVSERWFNETSLWLGSNYYDAYNHKYENATFNYQYHNGIFTYENYNSTFIYQYHNDPFNYGPIRWEDQYVTSPYDHTILDYQLDDPTHKVITYWKTYGMGKVIVLGIASEKIAYESSFVKFFDKLLLEYALE